jgi:hypothetical protein
MDARCGCGLPEFLCRELRRNCIQLPKMGTAWQDRGIPLAGSPSVYPHNQGDRNATLTANVPASCPGETRFSAHRTTSSKYRSSLNRDEPDVFQWAAPPHWERSRRSAAFRSFTQPMQLTHSPRQSATSFGIEAPRFLTVVPTPPARPSRRGSALRIIGPLCKAALRAPRPGLDIIHWDYVFSCGLAAL